MHLFSFRLDIFIFFRMLRQIFLSCLASFSAFFRPLAKNNLLLFFIRIIRFLRFFRFVGIIFPAFFMWSWENFLSVSIIFLLSWNFFERKIRFFCFPLPNFGHVFPDNPDIFQVFFVGKLRNFSISSPYLYASPEFFQRKNPHFPKWIFRPTEYFLLSPEVIFAPSGRNFHLSGFFPHGPDARAPSRA